MFFIWDKLLEPSYFYYWQELNDLPEEFNISYNTLRTHLQSVFRKVEVSTQTELMIKINMFKNLLSPWLVSYSDHKLSS